MHIPDGFLDVKTMASTAILAGAAVRYGFKRAGEELGDKQVPLLGVVAAFIFAAQMLNFPIAAGTSGHFLGAFLAAVLLGPWLAAAALTVVLFIQMILYGDGGLLALGANVFNMAIVGGVVTYYIFAALRPLLAKNRAGFIASVALGSWLSVILASAFCALEIAASGHSPLSVVLPAMLSVHVLIGIGEAMMTVVVVNMILSVRPDLIRTYKSEDSLTTGGAGGITSEA
ncbi:MAG: energy-coupling factor ABC transporter permease [Actinomycetota bacterium]|nr:energy-coupling factor ABC transporter permease [Actinomycetota bacterium]